MLKMDCLTYILINRLIRGIYLIQIKTEDSIWNEKLLVQLVGRTKISPKISGNILGEICIYKAFGLPNCCTEIFNQNHRHLLLLQGESIHLLSLL